MMSNKKADICNMCQIKQTLKSGWGYKSPPQDQLKKKRFRRRWHTLSIFQRCDKCFDKDTGGGGNHADVEKAKTCLMLTYFKDESEHSIKGQFRVEKGSLSAVEKIIEDCPSKYKEFPNILRWELPAYGKRILYMLIENENEKELWIKAFETFFQIQDQNSNVEDEFDDKEAEKFQPETNSKLQRAIAASRKYRDKTPPFIDSTDQEVCYEHTDYPNDESLPPKRSGGSFYSNSEDGFEEESPRGYSYLPPKRSSQSSRSSSEINEPPSGYNYLPPKPLPNPNTENIDDEETPSGYNYLPPKHSSPHFIRSQSNNREGLDLNLQNHSNLPLSSDNSPSKEGISRGKRLKSNERNMNYCNVSAPKPVSPISSMNPWKQTPKEVFGDTEKNRDTGEINLENYSILPPPKEVPIQQKSKQKSLKMKSNQTDMNYSFVPPPKPVTPTSGRNPWKIKETKDMISDDNYSFVPPPKPVVSSPMSGKSPWKLKEIENQSQEKISFVPLPNPASSSISTKENYSILPPPKLASPTKPGALIDEEVPTGYNYLPPKSSGSEVKNFQKGISNMSVRQLSHEKYVGKSVNKYIQDTDTTKDENYINFAPIQQMKMIAKHNMKPVEIDGDHNSNGNSSYVNFKF